MTSLLPSRSFHWNFKIDVIRITVSCSFSSTTTRTTWQRSTLRAGSETGSRELESRAFRGMVSCGAKYSVYLVTTLLSARLVLTLHLLALALRVTSSSLPDLPLQVTIPSFRAEQKAKQTFQAPGSRREMPRKEALSYLGIIQVPLSPSISFNFYRTQVSLVRSMGPVVSH